MLVHALLLCFVVLFDPGFLIIILPQTDVQAHRLEAVELDAYLV
ncbi:hypothetical protein ACK8HJ_16245 [Vreelandella titanicae]|jgi:hypothetical protein|nr:hypothetical protein [Halomonas titanicae]